MRVPLALPLRSLLLTVSCLHALFPPSDTDPRGANSSSDSKQARDLVNVLQEAKQQIDPRLAEMARFGGGGGGGRFGSYRGRGGGGGRGMSRRY